MGGSNALSDGHSTGLLQVIREVESQRLLDLRPVAARVFSGSWLVGRCLPNSTSTWFPDRLVGRVGSRILLHPKLDCDGTSVT